MSSASLALRNVTILAHVDDKNERAHAIIKKYAAKHAAMDITIGAVSLIPGAGIPAIIAAIALQTQVIYKPMAEELARVYLSETDTYTDTLGNVAGIATVALEFAQEFALEFLAECAQELLVEAGMGAVATMIPIAGAAAAAALDYLIAQMLTWRVGTMTAIYFQNGASWIGDRKSTMEIAKQLTGGLSVGISELLSGGAKRKSVRVNFDEIPERVPEVKRTALGNISVLLKGFAESMPRPLVRECLIKMGLSAVLVDAAMNAHYQSAY